MEQPKQQDPEELEALFWERNTEAARLWALLRQDLEPEGFTWPKWLRFLRLRRDLIVLYKAGLLSASLLMGELSQSAKGDLGSYLLKVYR